MGDLGLIPGLGRSLGGGYGNPLQYSCLENPQGQRILVGCNPWGCKELDMTEQLSTHTFLDWPLDHYVVSFIVSCCCSVTQLYLFVIPWTTAHQASLSFTVFQNLLKLISIEFASNQLILCCPILLFPSIKVFSNEFALGIRCPKYWSFSFGISPSSEYSGLMFFKIDWFVLLAV